MAAESKRPADGASAATACSAHPEPELDKVTKDQRDKHYFFGQ
jgi:hypothetical protein